MVVANCIKIVTAIEKVIVRFRDTTITFKLLKDLLGTLLTIPNPHCTFRIPPERLELWTKGYSVKVLGANLFFPSRRSQPDFVISRHCTPRTLLEVRKGPCIRKTCVWTHIMDDGFNAGDCRN